MPELTALYSPTINSYKRYVPGVWAPLTATWGVENRTTAIRVIPGDKPQRDAHRVPPDRGRHQPVHRDGHVPRGRASTASSTPSSRRPAAERRRLRNAAATRLPRNLDERHRSCSRTASVARTVLGEPFVDHYVRTREWEVRQYAKAVSDWELKRYFESI